MQVFESCLEAMRAVKKHANNLDLHEDIYFAYNDYSERYFVTDNATDLMEKIHEYWSDSGCESEPEIEAEEYKIWVYMSVENKEKWPTLHKKAKNSALKTDTKLVRKSARIEPEYSVEFNIVS